VVASVAGLALALSRGPNPARPANNIHSTPQSLASSGALEPGREVAPCERSSDDEVRATAQILRTLNEARAAGRPCPGSLDNGITAAPALPLVELPALACAAHETSADMARRGFFAHVNPDGQGPESRLGAHGFHAPSAEVLAWGQSSPQEVAEAWLTSPDHCPAVLSPLYRAAGIGYTVGRAGKTMWTLVLGAPQISQ
jgi:uncharacterized protein YkwD